MAKKYLRILYILLLLFFLSFSVNAAEYHYHSTNSGISAVQNRWDTFMETLPPAVRDELQEISFRSLSDTADILSQKADIRYWIKLLLKNISGSLTDMPKIIAPLFALMLFMAAVQMLLPSAAGEKLQKAFLTYAGLVSALIQFQQTSNVLALTKATLDRLCNTMNLMTPVMEAVFLSTGSLTQRMVSTQAIVLFVTISGNFTGYILAPLTNLLFTLSAVSSICDEAKLTPLIGGLRKLLMRLIQLFTMFFSFMLSSQSILAKSADSLGMKTARFALGSFIPVAGGTLAEALSTLREGMSLIKNAAGIGGILVIILLLLPDLLQLGIYKFTLYLIGTGADLLKLEKFAALTHEIYGIIELLIAIVLFTALLFILLLILFTKAQVSV